MEAGVCRGVGVGLGVGVGNGVGVGVGVAIASLAIPLAAVMQPAVLTMRITMKLNSRAIPNAHNAAL